MQCRTRLDTAPTWTRRGASRDLLWHLIQVKSAAPSNLTRALRTLLGFDPSAGGTFAGWRERVRRDSSTALAASNAAGPRDASFIPADSSNVSPRVSAICVYVMEGCKSLASVCSDITSSLGTSCACHLQCADITITWPSALDQICFKPDQAVAEDETEAMDEARLAVQQIVLARQQPSELLPRAPPIIALQVNTVSSFSPVQKC